MFNDSEKKSIESLIDQIINNRISFITLGPTGTSSHATLLALSEEIKRLRPDTDIEISLKNTFDEVYRIMLVEDSESFALVPAAYERVTEFFWNSEFENIYNFSYHTPPYGLAVKKEFKKTNKESLVVASCPAVAKLFDTLKKDSDINDNPITYIKTSSTTEAALAVMNQKADVAVTNETSTRKFSGELVFISPQKQSEMLWCVFKRKTKESISIH